MYKFPLFLVFLFSMNLLCAQEKIYEINGEKIPLEQEVEGPLSIYWNIIDNEYRYFAEKDGTFEELKNTRENGNYQEEYKRTLEKLTADAPLGVENVKLVLYSLRDFAHQYNAAVDKNYSFQDNRNKLLVALGVYGGVSNQIYTYNPENKLAPHLGISLELIDPNLALRHSIILQLEHSAATGSFDYTSTGLSLQHRFKIINKNDFKFHLNTQLINFFYSEEIALLENETGEVTGEELQTGISLKTPLSFGLGADFRILPGGFITINYNDFFSIVMEDNGNFPVDFSVGYRMNL